jgi:dihydrolipoamide dehydrogenase
VIGVEFASIFAHLGTEVTIVEFLDHLVPNEDADAVAALEKAFTGRGVTLHLGAKGTRSRSPRTA